MNMISRRNRKFFGFEGIPFAEPPIGDLRFKSPLPPKPWNGTFDAGRKFVSCPQVNKSGEFIGDEDCLVLNVYTPQIPMGENSTLLPVMLYIYGGSFKENSIDSRRYGPDYLLDKDILLVFPNYRLGALGFLGTDDKVSPGNYGLKDMVRALEWTRDNIQYFGGDPNRVTLFGDSSGAISVHLLTLSNLTDGLFHKYVTQSGSGLTLATIGSSAMCKRNSFKLGKHLGCPTNSSTLLVDCLRGLPASQLVNTTWLLQKFKIISTYSWGPIVEPLGEGAIISQKAVDLIAAGKSRDLPWMCGFDREEGVVLTRRVCGNTGTAREVFKSIDSTLPRISQYENKIKNTEDWTTALKTYYLNNLTASNNVLVRNLTHLVGDVVVVYPTFNAFQQHLAIAKSLQYLYHFEYEGTLSYSYKFANGSAKNCGVAHGDDILYLFRSQFSYFGPPGSENNENDWKMVDVMVELWTSFAATGTPTTSIFNGTMMWEPFSSRQNYLRIGNERNVALENKNDFLKERMQFCRELFTHATWI